MTEYYDIIKLKKDINIFIHERDILIKLDGLESADHVKNDIDFMQARNKDIFFYISGGGTYLINQRYLVVVKRESRSLINGDTWSIFTGRANNEVEHKNPSMVVRELFEELLIYYDSKLCHPQNPKYQEIIDNIYCAQVAPVKIRLAEESIYNYRLRVRDKSRQVYSDNLFLSINRNNDINVVMIFSFSCNLAKLSFQDGEIDSGTPREVALLDLKTLKLVAVKNVGRTVSIVHGSERDEYRMTEHLSELVGKLRSVIISVDKGETLI